MISGNGGMAGARGRRGPIRGAAGVDLADTLDHCGRGRRAKFGKLSTAADRFRHVAARAGPIAEPAEELRVRGGQEVDRGTIERARLGFENGTDGCTTAG